VVLMRDEVREGSVVRGGVVGGGGAGEVEGAVGNGCLPARLCGRGGVPGDDGAAFESGETVTALVG
jgi:hypothetical protein